MLWAGHDESLIDPEDVVSVALAAWSEVRWKNSATRKQDLYALHLLVETLVDFGAMLVVAIPNISVFDSILRVISYSSVWYNLLEVNLSWSTPSRE